MNRVVILQNCINKDLITGFILSSDKYFRIYRFWNHENVFSYLHSTKVRNNIRIRYFICYSCRENNNNKKIIIYSLHTWKNIFSNFLLRRKIHLYLSYSYNHALGFVRIFSFIFMFSMRKYMTKSWPNGSYKKLA